MDGQLCHCFRALYLDLDMLQNKVDRGFKALSYLESAADLLKKDHRNFGTFFQSCDAKSVDVINA